MRTNQEASVYIHAFVDQLYQSGVHHVVISPGSRSTPLAMTLAEYGNMKLWVHVDERSAGYFALGMAKSSGHPVALLCTSGSAAANYYPAVVEAFYGRIPLIVLTADRPHELRDVGAPQTINQSDMFAKHVKWFMEMAVPESSPSLVRYVQTTARRAVAAACSSPAGPVHLNFPFREPLVPDFSALSAAGGEQELPVTPQIGNGVVSSSPAALSQGHVTEGVRMLPEQDVEVLADKLLSASRGMIVCGPLTNTCFREEMIALAEQLSYPLLADPLSNLRSGEQASPVVIDAYDAFLRDGLAAKALKPDLILRFGAMPVSKPYLQFVQLHRGSQHLVVDDGTAWRDPAHLATEMIYAEPKWLCEALLRVVSQHRPAGEKGGDSSRWLSKWQAVNRLTRQAIREEMERFDALFEGRVFEELAKLLPDPSLLYVGNSMPVRDLDTFFPSVTKQVRLLGNRGTNGIDGLISSALGASSVSKEPVVLVLGDLSFYHDLNGLLPAKLYDLDLTIILVNNDGGGIFSFLPQAGHPRYFETLFGTPLGLEYRHAATMYGGSFTRIDSWPAFREAFSSAVSSKGLHVIEIPTERKSNVNMHHRIWQAVSVAIADRIPKVEDK
ncbi:2-succinyl-5-enolpyruvyl-6-hydroxy-3-cyclohexene-1-carboxylate synthase [Caldalkalibacillus uzonensis]|uniref:2-succinyl-5-enolpyruvyl-6-hydroxy-3-cyclohexene-1-carboxylate synthase n=1 Tax=Caldalkalibacillus uzonensis TaxID=353224 RepID=A0ABU0CPR6_9BACI|nr:2-succinyl-5-enolpyruvyl-6-hydroxy-3-cyclohexene-1-carboxylic-acid synthase [Caldalkalibacillus uzonensis]MDQ0337500.1 2-succinyl-5-enolpyruvyl-6-hydroxy-3-cyclohexene-1-carboxylate synthase [Caldalkalibacillus uzonensis]